MQTGEDVYLEEEGGTPEDALKRLREKLKSCEKEKQDYLEGWQRAKADFVNFKRQSEEREKELVGIGKRSVFAELIALADHFEQAMRGQSWEDLDGRFRSGIEGIYRELIKILEGHRIKQFKPLGESFDPNRHESLGTAEGEEGVVVEVLQSGYEEDDLVLRAAKVKIGRSKGG